MLSETLQRDTKNNHLSLEKKLIGQIKSISDIPGYIKLLTLFYSYFGGLEIALSKHIDLSFLPDYQQRRKTAALANDLLDLAATIPLLAAGEDLPAIENHFQALGALYVIEGSTLGGKIIGKIINNQIVLSESCGLSFFNGYGDETAAMWDNFRKAIDLPFQPDEEKIIVDSANDVFIRFGRWFDLQG